MGLLSRMPTRRGGAPVSSLRVAVVLGGLLAVVAVVAAGHRAGSGHGGRPSQAFFDYLLSGFLVFMAVGTVALVYLLWQERDEGLGARDPAAQRRKTVGVLVVVLVLATALVIARELGFRPSVAFQHSPLAHLIREAATAVPGKAAGDSSVALPLAARCARRSVLPRGPALAAWMKAHARVEAEDQREAAEEVAAALDDSVDDLRAEPDARRAIIAAYARMERALGVVGVRRAPSEAPLEYLARALEGLHASGVSVRRLTELFRLAKFSRHPLGPEDKERAINALVTVRDELRAES